ncbi:MAG TPA: hypothetical protein VL495_06135 [Edaphobacter sp.]|jgi:hypothetical protein|nr:hypothetical protein [Edaphobacter sp.]
MKALLRIAYRGMLHLYPASFRSEFADEMLWIFDEEVLRGNTTALFVDAARCIVVRHMRPPSEQLATSGYYVEIESALPAQRIAQMIMAIGYLGVGFAIILAPEIIWILKVGTVTHGVDHGWLSSHLGAVATWFDALWPRR